MIAVDTNVLIYACDRADSSAPEGRSRFHLQRRDGVLLWQVACEFISARKLSKQGFTRRTLGIASPNSGRAPLVLPSEAILGRAKELHLVRSSVLGRIDSRRLRRGGRGTSTQRTCLGSTISRACASSIRSSSRVMGAEEGDATSGRGWPPSTPSTWLARAGAESRTASRAAGTA